MRSVKFDRGKASLMRSEIAFIFPGQGSQSVGMGKDLFDSGSSIKKLYQKASEVLGYDLAKLCFEGPSDQLNQTEYTQPALLVTSLAAYELVKGGPLIPGLVAGHSLGEYTALVAAGALGFHDAVSLVQKRGRYMAEAVIPGTGLVSAILGLSASEVWEVCREAESIGVVAPANFNSPAQIVIAGEKAAVERAGEIAKKRGAKRVKPLPVSVPVHTPLIQTAADRLQKDIDELSWSDLQVPLINNVEAKALSKAEALRTSLVQQLPAPVRWEESILVMKDAGIQHFVEIGPGKVLTGLVKRIAPDVRTWNITDTATYEQVVQEIC